MAYSLQTLLFTNEIKNFICEKFLRYHAAIKMFRDIGDKLGVIRGEIGLAKCLVQMKQYKDAMNYYQLAVKGSHAAGNKVRCDKKILNSRFSQFLKIFIKRFICLRSLKNIYQR